MSNSKNTNKIHKAIQRQAFIDNGLYGAFQERTVPCKKKYSRKGRTDKAYLGGQD